MLTLYDFEMAPSPRRARILLAEKAVPFTAIQVDLRQKEQLGDAFRAINPRCTVPALRLEDGAILTDNAGIAAYLEATYPEPPMTGRTALERAEVASWNARIEMEGFMAIAEALRNSAPAMKDRALTGAVNYAQIPELAQRGLARAQQFFVELDSHLAGREFTATEGFSLADITAVVALDFARVVRIKPGDDHPNLMRWRKAMGERPSMAT
ncbi:MAG: glutathione S-transferase [Betaproteobacteria bacterium]|nr:glutathione S-transferase [Betaproteobacteria bacterium]